MMKTDEFSLSDILDLFRRNRKTLVRWTIGVALAGILVAYLYPPTYQASSKVIVKTANQAVSLSGKTTDPDNVVVTIEDEINTEMEIVRSRPVLENAVKRMQEEQPDASPKDRTILQEFQIEAGKFVRWLLQVLQLRPEVSELEARIAELNENITLNPILDSSVIEIIASSDSPTRAAAMANLVTEEYMAWHLEVYRGRGASGFYNEQLRTTRERLEKLEDELAQFKEEEGLVSISETKRNLLEQLSVHNTALSELEKQIISEESNLRVMREQMQDEEKLLPSLDIGETPWIQEAMNDLMEMELQLNELKQKYTGTHRDITNLEGEIKATKDFIRNEVEKVIQLKSVNLRSLKAERAALRKVIGDIQAQINVLPKKELVIERYERSIGEAKSIYASLSMKMEESNITESSDERVVNLKLISKAYPPLGPSFPNKILTILISPFIGLVCGLAISLVREFWTGRFFSREEVEEELGIPVVSELPERRHR